ncbi:hypothetical protein WA538_003741, partial [Blastocystis sp. DL]
NRLTGYTLAAPEFDTTLKYGIFVTLHKLAGSRRDLRGCIGCLAPIPLENMRKYAIYSAFRDNRFSPVMLEEIPHLECEVSLLHSFEKVCDPLDWVVGKHGIIIDFEVDGESFSATYLPEVAQEQGWDQKTTLKYLVSKAGYFFTDDLLDAIEVTRYQTEKDFMKFEEYVKMTKERGRDVTTVFKDRGVDLDLWHVCCP